MDPESGLEVVRADARDVEKLTEAISGAGTVYHCANAPYHRWEQELPPIWDGMIEASRRVGARLVIGTNLYALGDPNEAGGDGMLRPGAAAAPCSRKGRVRAELEARALDAHGTGDLEVALVRASDFYGPEVEGSVLGERFFGRLVAGKPAQLYGSRDVPHSYAFLPDFAQTMVAVATADRSEVWGRDWIAPHDEPRTTDELETMLAELQPGARISTMGRGMLTLGGLFAPPARETIEMLYEFDRPFVVDASDTTATFGLSPTPLRAGFRATQDWYRRTGGD